MTQYHLTKRVITLLRLEDSNPIHTPASGWNYRSIVGLMMYQANNSRPDITFTVNQVARYANNPRCCHEFTVKCIGQYLEASLYTDSERTEHT